MQDSDQKEEIGVVELHLRLPKGVVDAIDERIKGGQATTRSGLITQALFIWMAATDPKFKKAMEEMGKDFAQMLGPTFKTMAKELEKVPDEEKKKIERKLVKKFLERLR